MSFSNVNLPKRKVLVVDNYDSFVYNLVYLLRQLGQDPVVVRNDHIGPEEAAAYDYILLSPGPGVPDQAGNMKVIVSALADKASILGVCLGHQAIAEVFGAKLYNLSEPLHGVATSCRPLGQDPLYQDMPKEFMVARYHSWSVEPTSMTPELTVTALDDQNRILGIRHRKHKVWGVQFHPESFLTPEGKYIIKNWLSQD